MAEPTDGEVVAAASDRVDRNDMAERSRERPCFVGGVLRARRLALVPGAKSGGCSLSPPSRSVLLVRRLGAGGEGRREEEPPGARHG